MRFVDLRGAVIPTAPSVDGPLVKAGAVRGCDPLGPESGGFARGAEGEHELFAFATFPRADQNAIHLRIGLHIALPDFHHAECFGRARRSDQKARTGLVTNHRRLAEGAISLWERHGLVGEHERSHQPVGRVGDREGATRRSVDGGDPLKARVLAAVVVECSLNGNGVPLLQHRYSDRAGEGFLGI